MPLAAMKNVVKSKLLVYQQEEERKQKEEQARLEAEAAKARKIEEARLAKEKQDAEDERNRQLAIVREAEASGDMVAANEAHLAVQSATETIMKTEQETQEIQFAPPVMVPAATKIAGVSTGTHWTFEVQNLMELVKAVAAGTAPITYLVANETAIRKVVSALKENAVIPGVRVWPESSIRTR